MHLDDVEWSNVNANPNPWRAGSAMHWIIFHYKRTDSHTPQWDAIPSRFTKVPIASEREMSHNKRSSYRESLISELLEVCDEQDYCILPNGMVFFTRKDHAITFKLKCSELIA